MQRAVLEKAAFWDQTICVDCEAAFDPSDAAEDRCCPHCGSGRLISASSGLTLVELLEEEDE